MINFLIEQININELTGSDWSYKLLVIQKQPDYIKCIRDKS